MFSNFLFLCFFIIFLFSFDHKKVAGERGLMSPSPSPPWSLIKSALICDKHDKTMHVGKKNFDFKIKVYALRFVPQSAPRSSLFVQIMGRISVRSRLIKGRLKESSPTCFTDTGDWN